jgi:hypothetical protein
MLHQRYKYVQANAIKYSLIKLTVGLVKLTVDFL